MQRRGIARGQRRGRGRTVHADAERGGELRQRGQQQAAGAGAEVQHQSRRLAVGECRDGRLDQRFRFGSRDQRGGRDGELRGSRTRGGRGSAPAVRAPRAARPAARALAMSAGAAGSRSRACRRDAVRMGQQQPCLQPGIVDARPRAAARRRGRSPADRVAQAAWLAARFACARSSRRFRALASTVRRPSGVAEQVGVDAALLLDGADRAGGQPHADRLRRGRRTAARYPADWAGSGGGSGCWRG